MNSTTRRKIAAEQDLADRPAVNAGWVFSQSVSGSMISAPSTGAADRAVAAEERHQHQREVEQRVEAGLRLRPGRCSRTRRAPIIAVIAPEMTNAVSLTRMALTPRPRARSSSSLIARSCRPNRDRLISQAMAIVPGREGERDVVEGRVVARAGQLRNGESSPLEPPVNQKLNAISWKMKKTAIVITMNVCRRTRSAISPNGTAMSAPDRARERQQREDRGAL